MSRQTEVYFHVGLPKTASTYLQALIFPKLKGIKFFPKKKFNKYKNLHAQRAEGKFLFSSETDRWMDEKLKEISEYYPDAGIIFVFRRHDQWISSKYNYHLRKNGRISFDELFNLENTAAIEAGELTDKAIAKN